MTVTPAIANNKKSKRNIFLIGFMGCGKTTVAETLSRLYGMEMLEMDRTIARKEGISIPEIFSSRGEEYFRGLETGLLRSLKGKDGLVVSCGGGAAMRPENVALMRDSGCICLLTARPETILSRVSGDDGRPLLKGRKTLPEIASMIESRRPAYEAAADFSVATDGRSPEQIAAEILSAAFER